MLGLNGAGKTSLLRILAGETEPTLGDVELGHDVVARLLRPGARGHHAGPHRCSTTCASSASTGSRDADLRALLGMFGLIGDKVFQDAGTLSGGEKTKLALAQLVAGRHNLLLLDEPTNNLDPPSREAVGARAVGVAGRDGHRQPRHRVRGAARSRTGCC